MIENVSPKKFLGQHFLIDENISKKIVNSVILKEFDKIVKYYLDKETNTEDMIEELKEFSDKEKNKVIIDNEEYYDFGSFVLCWGIVETLEDRGVRV